MLFRSPALGSPSFARLACASGSIALLAESEPGPGGSAVIGTPSRTQRHRTPPAASPAPHTLHSAWLALSFVCSSARCLASPRPSRGLPKPPARNRPGISAGTCAADGDRNRLVSHDNLRRTWPGPCLGAGRPGALCLGFRLCEELAGQRSARATMGVRIVPMDSTSTSTSSPGPSSRGGLKLIPTPPGVPVAMTSPALSVTVSVM